MFKSLLKKKKKKVLDLDVATENKIMEDFFNICNDGSDILFEDDLLNFSVKFRKDYIKELRYDIVYYKRLEELEIENMVKTGRFITLNFINQQTKNRDPKKLNRLEKEYLNKLEFKNTKLILKRIYKHLVEIEKKNSQIKFYLELTPEEFNSFIFCSMNNGKPVKYKHFVRFMADKY